MPAPAHIVQEDIVGPSLGQASINAGIMSFIVALILLMVYMCSMYGFIPGMVANGALVLNLFFTLGILSSFQEALAHIRKYGSKHSECIITDDKTRAEWFCREVDAACVYVNAPTSFTDGAQFGLGAEIGISTQKLHARGPMALEEITTYKWIVEGSGQTRP
jgi:hypothetical protein